MGAKENRRKFKRRIFLKTLQKYMSQAGIPRSAVDLKALDLDSYERVEDLIADIASNPYHEYNHVFSQILRTMQRDYIYEVPNYDAQAGASDMNEELEEIKAEISILEKRLAKLEDQKALEHDDVATELHNAVYELKHDVASLSDRLAALTRDLAQGPSQGPRKDLAQGPSQGPRNVAGGEGEPTRGLKLVLAVAVTLLLCFTIIPTAAYTNQWSLAETITYSVLFCLLCIGLIALEGVWVSVAFNTSRRAARSFAAGYIYSKNTNPYKNT